MASLLSQASAYDGSETISTNYELGERTNRTNTGAGGRTNAKTIKKRPSYGVEPERKKSIEALMSMTQMNDEEKKDGDMIVDVQYMSGSPLEDESGFQSLTQP